MSSSSTNEASTSGASTSRSIPHSSPSEKPPEESKQKNSFSIGLNSQLTTYFIAGGCAGAASRTVVSPLERLKIIQQVQPRDGGQPYKGVYRSLVRMWKEEGFKGYMRGNGINCVRIIPYSAVQFTAYETFKKASILRQRKSNIIIFFSNDGARPLDTPTRLLAGALAGICSVSATYPLDLTRARLSIASASMLAAPPPPTAATTITTTASLPRSSSSLLPPLPTIPGMWGMMVKIYVEEGGVRALYRGIVPTAVGVAPYVGINFAAYEWLRGIITPPGRDHAAWEKLLCGAMAGTISQTLTYPFDVLRRKMQVSGLKSLGDGKPIGAFKVINKMWSSEGVRGFYRGLWPNLLKVAPSIATSFYVYETVKELLA
ncbi:mitochondrial carrier [Clavulina sp. PMI_390]|nr:mitochondrial carrier [Clavulina sp. PMI_390]